MKEIKKTLEEFYNAILGIESPWIVAVIPVNAEISQDTYCHYFKYKNLTGYLLFIKSVL